MTSYIKSKKIKRFSRNRGLAILNILIILAVLSCGFLYLIQTNSLVSCSYEIRQQKEHLEKLQVENQNIEMEIAQWQSPVNLEEIVQSLGMIESGQVIYLNTEKEMAMKE
ncbi:MAG: septum formation initiator family protein [Candidatus Portnoybacteria bacterium]|nr:septum formation initiator family protein [Candidatus Portnoybacteria bacterium]